MVNVKSGKYYKTLHTVELITTTVTLGRNSFYRQSMQDGSNQRRKNDMDKYQDLLSRYGGDILASSGMERSKNYIQHGSTSVYAHSVFVALMCLFISRELRLKVDEKALVRGALLHDFFLYDWHEKNKSHRWHGFTHPKKALENARSEFQISRIEEDMILCHMFPLTLKVPHFTESWILCCADKICSIHETLVRKGGKHER